MIGTPWASGYYRMYQAANLLASSGFAVQTITFEDIIPMELKASRYDFISKKYQLIDMCKFDTVVFQLVWHKALLLVIDRLNAEGIRTSMEVDDDYFALPRSNPSWISFHPKIKMERHVDSKNVGRLGNEKVNYKLDVLKQTCKKVSMIQVSTPELAEVYRKLNSNVIIIQNCIENELYDAIPRRNNYKPVIGWFGTKTHMADLAIVLGCFPPEDTYTLLIAGHPEARYTIFKDLKNVEVIPPYKVEEVPNIVAKCDIGIVPLVNCRFNDGKSDLKGIEFGAGSVPVIASDVAPYRRWIRHGVNGYLVKKNKTKFWIRYMRELVHLSTLRKRMGGDAKKDAIKRDIRKHIHVYINAYFT